MAATIPEKFRGRTRRDAAAFYLAELAKGLLAGEVGIVSGQGTVRSATSEFLLLDIKVVQRKRGNRVEITVRWPRRPLIRVASSTEGDMGEQEELEFEGAASPAEVADTLCRIADGIRQRALSVSLGEEEITVYPDGDLALEIQATEKKSKAKIEIAIAWRRRPADTDTDDR